MLDALEVVRTAYCAL